MDEVVERVAKYIESNEMIGQRDTVLLGVSGGADSVCLLCVLAQLSPVMGFKLKVMTVEHGIRGEESVEDARFVERLCVEKGIPCKVVSVDAPGASKSYRLTLEEAARKLRYDAFFSQVKEGGIIATAHHANDNAETFLFNLIRGSDLRGLSGIAPVSFMQGRKIIRPLLCLDRGEIEAFLDREDQDYRTDSTNEVLDCDRNRIRLSILPELIGINSGSVKHINEAAGAIRRSCESGEEEAKSFVEDSKVFKGMDARKLMFLPEQNRGSVIMTWLRGELPSVKDIGRVHIEAVLDIAEGAPGRGVDIPGGYRIERTYRELVIKTHASEPVKRGIDDQVIPPLHTGETYQLSFEGYDISMTLRDASWAKGKEIPQKTYYKWFDYGKIRRGLTLRHRRQDDRIIISRSGMHKSIRDLCKDEKIDRDIRDELMLLADGNEIVWVIGFRSSEGYLIDSETSRILEISIVRS